MYRIRYNPPSVYAPYKAASAALSAKLGDHGASDIEAINAELIRVTSDVKIRARIVPHSAADAGLYRIDFAIRDDFSDAERIALVDTTPARKVF